MPNITSPDVLDSCVVHHSLARKASRSSHLAHYRFPSSPWSHQNAKLSLTRCMWWIHVHWTRKDFDEKLPLGSHKTTKRAKCGFLSAHLAHWDFPSSPWPSPNAKLSLTRCCGFMCIGCERILLKNFHWGLTRQPSVLNVGSSGSQQPRFAVAIPPEHS